MRSGAPAALAGDELVEAGVDQLDQKLSREGKLKLEVTVEPPPTIDVTPSGSRP